MVDREPHTVAQVPPAVLQGYDGERFWLGLTLALGIVAAVAFLVMGFAAPGGIQNDARQFLSWMGRWSDPGLLAGDLVADYWRSVTPWFYTALFKGAWLAGIEPATFVKVLPALLFPLIALFAFRFLRAIGAEPPVAFVAAGALLPYIHIDDPVVSGVPRALWPVLLLAILDGLARRRIVTVAIAQLLLAGTYPQMALVAATLIGLTFVDPRQPHLLDLSRFRLALVGIAAVATVAGLLPFLVSTDGFGPVVSLEDARHMPIFGFEGRNRIFEADGSRNFLCGRRLGFLGNRCGGSFDGEAALLLAAIAIGPLVLFRRSVGRKSASGSMRSTLPLFLLLASVGWFAVAQLLLFRLHLPSRYSAPLVPLAILTTLPLLLEALRRQPIPSWAREHPAGRLLPAGAGAIVCGLLVFGAANVRPSMRVPDRPDLVEFVAALPRDAVIAGFVDDLDFSPVFTSRSTLFTRTLTIGYQLGYLRPVLERMGDMRDAILTADPAVLAERLRKHRVSTLLVDADTLAAPAVPKRFRGFFAPDELAASEAEARAGRPSALSLAAPHCETRRFGTVLALDAACLVRTAGAPRN